MVTAGASIPDSGPFDPVAHPPAPIFGIGNDVVSQSCTDFEVDAVFRGVVPKLVSWTARAKRNGITGPDRP
jgi:hypothetical protein